MKTIDSLRTINGDAIDKMEQAVDEINKLMPSSNLDDEARLIARRASLQAQINNQAIVRAHLRASVVVVDFDPADETALDSLNNQMDRFIVSGLAVGAMLSLVPTLIDTAIGIGNSINSNTGAG